jgi:hypothetical protein
MILLCSRQSGKSTVTSLLALHEALYNPSALILLLSPSLRQSQELFRRVKDFYNALPSSAVTAREESALRMEFSNGSRIVALPGSERTVRGYSAVDLLVCDEAARCEDALWYSISPMLAVSGGRIILLSTPFGKRGFFHHEWEEGGEAWHRTRIPASSCPRIPSTFLEQEKRSMPPLFYRSEYEVEFVETLDQVFAYEDIQRALETDASPLFGV